ncbi:hypothetical protein BOTBODRAFT_587519 [Botryobasidium botryosum FD-172 SS1]|uniref:Uncharacterized protein n=1 Tax=Botryobasidium botryosum (strain FD-172 SS1) TaxID=930990 RepID=A0A067LX79_BOTB1|nr:hypothetical protein BOTBODRAFT_587500 [Botryobasidium botryosum FD-172 SS1]KDQ07988.1 hypothetical protein BOTBODRAFT_587519 [Botryobasidium botryosum FD-172 SS1]
MSRLSSVDHHQLSRTKLAARKGAVVLAKPRRPAPRGRPGCASSTLLRRSLSCPCAAGVCGVGASLVLPRKKFFAQVAGARPSLRLEGLFHSGVAWSTISTTDFGLWLVDPQDRNFSTPSSREPSFLPCLKKIMY